MYTCIKIVRSSCNLFQVKFYLLKKWYNLIVVPLDFFLYFESCDPQIYDYIKIEVSMKKVKPQTTCSILFFIAIILYMHRYSCVYYIHNNCRYLQLCILYIYIYVLYLCIIFCKISLCVGLYACICVCMS